MTSEPTGPWIDPDVDLPGLHRPVLFELEDMGWTLESETPRFLICAGCIGIRKQWDTWEATDPTSARAIYIHCPGVDTGNVRIVRWAQINTTGELA